MDVFLIQYGFAGFAVMQLVLIAWIIRRGADVLKELSQDIKDLTGTIKTYIEVRK